MTDLLYLPSDDYKTSFQATVTNTGDDYVVLDQTLFYKTGGGQPCDHGRLSFDDESIRVTQVKKEHGEIRHYLEGPVPPVDTTVEGEVDWERRYDHMRMHTAQHLVSWVVLERFGAGTAGNQVHRKQSRIDFSPVAFEEEDLRLIEDVVNDRIAEDLTVEKTQMSRDNVESRVADGRTNLDLIPDVVDPLRVVIIGDEDLCPCGGTHVNGLGELGGFSIVDTENKGADTERLVFELD